MSFAKTRSGWVRYVEVCGVLLMYGGTHGVCGSYVGVHGGFLGGVGVSGWVTCASQQHSRLTDWLVGCLFGCLVG